MKAITVLEPWASLIAAGEKKIETRSWATKYRGKIAIHAGMQWRKEQKEIIETEPFGSSLFKMLNEHTTELKPSAISMTETFLWRLRNRDTLGKVITIAELIDVQEVTANIVDIRTGIPHGAVIGKGTTLKEIRGNEYLYGNYPVGGYAWILENIQRIEPVTARGQQRIWTWDEIGWKK